jgi:hypothetical protein
MGSNLLSIATSSKKLSLIKASEKLNIERHAPEGTLYDD